MPKKMDWTQIIPLGVMITIIGFMFFQIIEIRKDFSDYRVEDAERYYEMKQDLGVYKFQLEIAKGQIKRLEERSDEDNFGIRSDISPSGFLGRAIFSDRIREYIAETYLGNSQEIQRSSSTSFRGLSERKNLDKRSDSNSNFISISRSLCSGRQNLS